MWGLAAVLQFCQSNFTAMLFGEIKFMSPARMGDKIFEVTIARGICGAGR